MTEKEKRRFNQMADADKKVLFIKITVYAIESLLLHLMYPNNCEPSKILSEI